MSELKEAITYFEQLLRRFEDAPDETYWGKEHNATTRKMIGIAIDALRRAQPENEALTLSELRGMGGEPVWIQESAPYTFAGYKILCSPVVDEYEDVCFEGGDCYYSHDYGKTWLAYRTKPERSEGE